MGVGDTGKFLVLGPTRENQPVRKDPKKLPFNDRPPGPPNPPRPRPKNPSPNYEPPQPLPVYPNLPRREEVQN
jgi:hypothetical protein